MAININYVVLFQIFGVLLGALIGVCSANKYKGKFNKKQVTLIVSFFMILGFLAFSIRIFFCLWMPALNTSSGEDKVTKVTYELLKNQSNQDYSQYLSSAGYTKYVGLFTFAGLAAGGIFAGMLGFLKSKRENWNVIGCLFFLLATILFIGFLTLAFRWWLVLRDLGNKILVDDVLNLEKLLRIKYSNLVN